MNKKIITGITWDHPRGYNPLIASSALYEKLYGVKVKWKKRSLTMFGDQSLEELAQKFDFIIIDHPHVGVAEATKCLLPFNELLKKDELTKLEKESAGPSFLSYRYKGNQWALPIDAAMQSSSFRPDLMEELRVPKNWNDVFELTDILRKKKLQVGMALCPTDALCTFLTITAQSGSPVIEENEMLVNHEKGIESLEMMRKMCNSFHKKSLDWNPIQLYDYMSTNNDIAYTPLAFCYTNYARHRFRKNKLSFSNAPGIRNALLGGAGIAISAKSKYIKEAAKYATWVCSSEAQSSVYVMEHGQPANVVAWRSDFANCLTYNFFSNTIATLTNAFVRPRYAGWPEFQTTMGEIIHDYLKNGGEASKVIDHLQDLYRRSHIKTMLQ